MLSVVDVASSAPELQGATGGWGGRARVLATHTRLPTIRGITSLFNWSAHEVSSLPAIAEDVHLTLFVWQSRGSGLASSTVDGPQGWTEQCSLAQDRVQQCCLARRLEKMLKISSGRLEGIFWNPRYITRSGAPTSEDWKSCRIGERPWGHGTLMSHPSQLANLSHSLGHEISQLTVCRQGQMLKQLQRLPDTTGASKLVTSALVQTAWVSTVKSQLHFLGRDLLVFHRTSMRIFC